MNIIPQVAPASIRYAVHVWRGDAKISGTEPTTDQGEARDMLRALRVPFPDSVLVVEGADREWSPVSDEMLDRLNRQRAALALAGLMLKSPTEISWSLHMHSPAELSGHAYKRETIEELAALLKVACTERTTGEHLTVRATGVFAGVPVEVYCVARVPELAETVTV